MSARWDHDQKRLRGDSLKVLVGVDEAGRGALAGPVVAGAVALESGFFKIRGHRKLTGGIDDSKKLTGDARESLYTLLEDLSERGHLLLAWGSASVDEIEALNILGATRLAMRRALEFLQNLAGPRWRLSPEDAPQETALFSAHLPGDETANVFPDVLVDGRPLKPFPYRHEGMVGGDGASLCIAMASIVAKVRRDRELTGMSREFPEYKFEENKGYGTPDHREALLKTGPCLHHRPSFLRKLVAADPPLQPDLGF